MFGASCLCKGNIIYTQAGGNRKSSQHKHGRQVSFQRTGEGQSEFFVENLGNYRLVSFPVCKLITYIVGECHKDFQPQPVSEESHYRKHWNIEHI